MRRHPRLSALTLRPGVILALLAGICWGSWTPPVGAGEASPSLEEAAVAGEHLFAERCSSCHTTEAAPSRDWPELANLGGPDLAGPGSKYRPGWLAAWLADPVRLRPAGFLPFRHTVSTAQGDRIVRATLEEHPSLPPREATAVAAWLESQEAPAVPFPAAGSGGSIRASIHFHKILPCGGCHRTGSDGGGVSGPDLTRAAERLQPEWVRSFLWDPRSRGSRLMPRVRLRADQLEALAGYIESPGEPAGKPLPAAVQEEGPAEGAPPRLAQPPSRARTIYLLLCAQCHGIAGDGHGINAPYLFIAPRDHSSPEEMGRLSDEHIFNTVKLGGAAVGKSSLMPSWGAVLADEDISLLVGYLRELSGTEGP